MARRVLTERQDEQHTGKLSPGRRGRHDGEYERPDTPFCVDGTQLLAAGYDAAKVVAKDTDKDGGQHDAGVGQSKDEPGTRGCWIVDVVVSRDRTPRAAYAEYHGKVG